MSATDATAMTDQRAGVTPVPVPAVPRAGRATLGQQLIGADLITPEQLDLALAEGSQKGLRLGEVLVEMGMVQEDAILPFIEGHLGVRSGRHGCAGKHQAKNGFLHGQLPRQRPGIEEAKSAVRC